MPKVMVVNMLIELLLFAGIAFLIINKLVNVLGSVDEDEQRNRRSMYGEPVMKDVTMYDDNLYGVTDKVVIATNEVDDKSIIESLDDANDSRLLDNVKEMIRRVDGFHPDMFVKNAGEAVRMILKAVVGLCAARECDDVIEHLVDRRYVPIVRESADTYKRLLSDGSSLAVSDVNVRDMKISSATFFGNNVIVAIALTVGNRREIWSFSKSTLQISSDWILTNIDL